MPLKGILKIHQFNKNTLPGKRCLYQGPLPHPGGYFKYFNGEAVYFLLWVGSLRQKRYIGCIQMIYAKSLSTKGAGLGCAWFGVCMCVHCVCVSFLYMEFFSVRDSGLSWSHFKYTAFPPHIESTPKGNTDTRFQSLGR